MNFYCIADADTVRGFRLAGVQGEAVGTAREAADALTKAAALSEVGIILLTQEFAAGARSHLEGLRSAHERPLIVEIPGPRGPVPDHKSLRHLVQEAVGIRLGG